MQKTIALVVLADDRSGIVERLSQILRQADGNWVESSMLARDGKFAGVLYATLPDSQLNEALEAFRALAEEGIQVLAEAAGKPGLPHSNRVALSLVGQDRPGIVQEITQVLVGFGVTVDELNTEVSEASMSGEMLFNANARLGIPDDCELAKVQAALERLADELMVDINLEQFRG